jgi:hypothetical protein
MSGASSDLLAGEQSTDPCRIGRTKPYRTFISQKAACAYHLDGVSATGYSVFHSHLVFECPL